MIICFCTNFYRLFMTFGIGCSVLSWHRTFHAVSSGREVEAFSFRSVVWVLFHTCYCYLVFYSSLLLIHVLCSCTVSCTEALRVLLSALNVSGMNRLVVSFIKCSVIVHLKSIQWNPNVSVCSICYLHTFFLWFQGLLKIMPISSGLVISTSVARETPTFGARRRLIT
jgi:hypothetical protein